MGFFGNFFDILIYTLWFMVLIGFFVVLVRIITDVFRDHELGGWGKAGWVIFVVFLPVIGAIVYLFARGDGMSRRDARAVRAARDAQREYTKSIVQEVGGSAGQVKAAKELLDSGVITPEEFERLKAKALR